MNKRLRDKDEGDRTGTYSKLLAMQTDVQAQTDLSDEGRLHRLAANIPGFIYTFHMSVDGHCSFPFASDGIQDIYGLGPEDVVADMAPLHSMAHPDDRPRIEDAIARSARELSFFNLEFRVLNPEKGVLWLESRSMPEREPDGSTRWYGFIHDVSERKRTEALLYASEQKFRTLAENSPDVIGRYDREGRRIYVNPQYERVSGVSAADCLGKTAREYCFVPPSVAARFSQKLEEALESGETVELDFSWTQGGKPTWWFVRIVPEFDAQGKVASALAISSDISERKAIEEALRAFAVRRDTDREEERRRIARELHDELGQQLAALRMKVGAVDMLFGKGQPRLHEEMMHLLTLVDKTIQVTRNVSTALRPAVLDMGIVAALEWLTAEFSEYSGLDCHLSVSEREVRLSEEMAVTIFRITQESLTNAARHSKAGSVAVTFNRETDAITLEVRDNGIGFETDGASRTGTFGLLGIRERALAVGGTAVVFSERGHGTSVYVHIPVGKGKDSDGA